jgi:HSP20 family protein
MTSEIEEATMNGPMTQARQQASQPEARQEAPSLMPRVDVLEDEAGITLLADLPGVAKEGLVVKVDGDALLLEGEISTATPEGMEATYAELRLPRFRRSFTLSRELDAGAIDASLKDGVLRLRIPKRAEAQPRRIAVKVT